MKFFDSHAESAFRLTDSGQKIFFPFGNFGKAYEVTSKNQYRELKDQLSKRYAMHLLVVLPFLIFISSSIIFGIATLAGVIIWQYLDAKKMLSSLRTSSQKLSQTKPFIPKFNKKKEKADLNKLYFRILFILTLGLLSSLFLLFLDRTLKADSSPQLIFGSFVSCVLALFIYLNLSKLCSYFQTRRKLRN